MIQILYSNSIPMIQATQNLVSVQAKQKVKPNIFQHNFHLQVFDMQNEAKKTPCYFDCILQIMCWKQAVDSINNNSL